MVRLPKRPGEKPKTAGCNPHQQVDQTSPPEVHDLLKRRAFDWPHVERRPSIISVPGAEALWLTKDSQPRCDDCEAAFLRGREFAHVHPTYDGSLHMMLPGGVVAEVLATGWGELHPNAQAGMHPLNKIMIFAPRTSQEVDVVVRLIETSYRFALGEIASEPVAAGW